MTKSEFTARLARKPGISIQEGEKILNAFLDSVEDGLCLDGRVPLPGLGVLETRENTPRKGRNPRTGEEMDIPARNTVRFKAAKELKLMLNEAE